MKCETGIFHGTRYGQIFDFKAWCAGRSITQCPMIAVRHQFLTGHGAGDSRFVKFVDRTFRNLLAIAKNREPLADFQHFAHFMADEKYRDALRLNIAHDLEKCVDFVSGEGGCRFIHDQ